jgi:integrase
MVITQADLGLRVAELLAVRVQDVDFLRRTVRVEFQTTLGRQVPSTAQDTKITTGAAVTGGGRQRTRGAHR